MKSVWVAGCVALLLAMCGVTVWPQTTVLEAESIQVRWSDDNRSVLLEATLPAGTSDSSAHTWVLTVYAHRFSDGLFAWQLHYSESADSVIVLPNDFLTARQFACAQLGIQVEATSTADSWSLRLYIPVDGPIPRLIAVGDLLELHALWIQQPAVASLTVPPPGLAAAPAAGGGGSESPADLPSDPLPSVDRYEQGQPVAHRFTLPAGIVSIDAARIVLSYTLLRLQDEGPAQFVRFAHISYDADTDTYFYLIETTPLPPGRYRLVIGSPNSSISARIELTIAPPGG